MEKKKVKDLVVGDVIQEDGMIFGIAQVTRKDEDFVNFVRPYILKVVSHLPNGEENSKYEVEEERFVIRISQDGETEYNFLGNNKMASYI